MGIFEEFQAQKVQEIRERLRPDWVGPDPDKPPFNLTSEDWDWFEKSVPFEAPKLVDLSKDQLYALFPKTGYKTRMVRTFIWQAWLRIQLGEIKPIRGNVRSFWYKYLEKFCRVYGLLDDSRSTRATSSKSDRLIDTLGEQMAKFVDHRIFRYTEELQFVSPLSANWKVGRKRRGWLFFTEKEGLWTICDDLWLDKKRSISVMASNGQPSGLVMEKLAEDLWKYGVRKLYIGTFCDHDPWGWCIDATIDWSLRRLGFEVETWRLATVDLYQADDAFGGRDYSEIITKFEDPNYEPTSKESIINNWWKLSHGFHGEPIALHADVILDEIRDKRIKDFLDALEDGKRPPGMKVNPKKEIRLVDSSALPRMYR